MSLAAWSGQGKKQDEEPEEVAARGPNEFERVLSNVEKNFREECGCNPWQAAALAEAGVDWHEFKKLLNSGCSRETAVLLLMPDDLREELSHG